MLFKQTFGHEHYRAGVAQNSCCKRHHEAEMREEEYATVWSEHRTRKKGEGICLLPKKRLGRRNL